MNLQKFYFIGFNPLKVFQSRPNVWMILFPNFRQRMSMPKGNVQKKPLGMQRSIFLYADPFEWAFWECHNGKKQLSAQKNWNFGYA